MYGVPVPSPQRRRAAVVSRASYLAAGAPVGPALRGTEDDPTQQMRTGGRTGGTGRPTGTRRDTWSTLAPGMMRAVCESILNYGFETFVRRVIKQRPASAFLESLHSDLQERTAEYYRGDVWPLKFSFGVLSRYVNGVADPGRKGRSPSVVTTWLSDEGHVCCSCLGRTSHARRARSAPVDAACQHSIVFSRTLKRLSRRLWISEAALRQRLPMLFDSYTPPAPALPNTTGEIKRLEDWDTEGPMETFIAGQSSVVVVLSGVGRYKVVAPVRCTRKVTSCAFCDSAAGFSCVHAVRARGVRRTQSASKRADHVSRSDEEDGARSRLPLSL